MNKITGIVILLLIAACIILGFLYNKEKTKYLSLKDAKRDTTFIRDTVIEFDTIPGRIDTFRYVDTILSDTGDTIMESRRALEKIIDTTFSDSLYLYERLLCLDPITHKPIFALPDVDSLAYQQVQIIITDTIYKPIESSNNSKFWIGLSLGVLTDIVIRGLELIF